MATNYARLINQHNSIYLTFFPLASIRLMKKMKEVMKLNYLFI